MFELTIEEHAERVQVSLRGELDISSSPQLESDLNRIEVDDPAVLVIDLQGLDFMDSAGLRILLAADARARKAGRRLVLVKGGEVIQRLFHVTRLDERFDFVDDPGSPAT